MLLPNSLKWAQKNFGDEIDIQNEVGREMEQPTGAEITTLPCTFLTSTHNSPFSLMGIYSTVSLIFSNLRGGGGWAKYCGTIYRFSPSLFLICKKTILIVSLYFFLQELRIIMTSFSPVFTSVWSGAFSAGPRGPRRRWRLAWRYSAQCPSWEPPPGTGTLHSSHQY